jgi:hypothetical protein
MGSEGNAAHIIMSGCKRADMSVSNNAYASPKSSASEWTDLVSLMSVGKHFTARPLHAPSVATA